MATTTTTGTRLLTAPGSAAVPALALDANKSRHGLVLQASGSVNALVWLMGNSALAPTAGSTNALLLVAGAPPLVLSPAPADAIYVGSATTAAASVVIAEL